MKRVPFVTILLALLLSACAQATPTTDPAQLQASAVAAANTMVALTQAAVPTETPIPPTPLPSPTALPSPTVQALPTLSILTSVPTVQSAPTLPSSGGGGGNTSGDPCQAPLAAKPAGPETTVHITNTLKANVILSLYLSKNDFGDCGYRGFNLPPYGIISATMPVGCYSAGAFINDPKKPSKSFGYGCVKNASSWSVSIGADVIKIGQ